MASLENCCTLGLLSQWVVDFIALRKLFANIFTPALLRCILLRFKCMDGLILAWWKYLNPCSKHRSLRTRFTLTLFGSYLLYLGTRPEITTFMTLHMLS